MPLPVTGAWCDSTLVTDTDMLVDLAALEPAAALGMLANRNLTGDQLREVASHAKFTAAETGLIAEAVMVGRTAEDQAVITTAAAATSAPTAAILAGYLRPSAAVLLIGDGALTPARRRAVVEGIGKAVTEPMRQLVRYARDPQLNEMLRLAGLADSPYALIVTAHAARTADDLLALTDRLANSRLFPSANADSLHLAAIDHPEVVEHWGRHGGELGAYVAAGDHRLDRDFLASLRPQVRDALLDGNPAMWSDSQAQVRELLADLEQLLLNPETRPEHHLTGAVYASRIDGLLDLLTGTDTDSSVDAFGIRRVPLIEIYKVAGGMSLVTLLHWLVSVPVEIRKVLANVAQMPVNRAIGPNATDFVLRHAPQIAAESGYARVPSWFNHRDDADQHHPQLQRDGLLVRDAVTVGNHQHRLLCRADPSRITKLTTASAWVALGETSMDTTLDDAVAEATGIDADAARFADILGNPLL